MKNKTYNFFSDSGHGWLEVPKADLRALGIAEYISPYSYQNGLNAYLEEDMDVTTFFKAYKEEFGYYPKSEEDAERGYEEESRIRDYDHYDE